MAISLTAFSQTTDKVSSPASDLNQALDIWNNSQNDPQKINKALTLLEKGLAAGASKDDVTRVVFEMSRGESDIKDAYRLEAVNITLKYMPNSPFLYYDLGGVYEYQRCGDNP